MMSRTYRIYSYMLAFFISLITKMLFLEVHHCILLWYLRIHSTKIDGTVLMALQSKIITWRKNSRTNIVKLITDIKTLFIKVIQTLVFFEVYF